MTLNPQTRFIFDILPLAVFFAGYKWLGLYGATAMLLAISLLILAVTWVIEKRIALSPLITAVAVAVFGGLTLWLRDERFIKMKPTLIYLTFATILFTGYFLKKGMLKPLLGTAMQLTEQGWRLLSLRWGCFFLCMAGLNEYVWRNFSTDAWVNFKVFGLLGLTFLFILLQAGFVQKHALPAAESTAKDAP